MAVSVISAAGVVTTKKASAAPTKTIVLSYQAGTTYTITPKQFNEHYTDNYGIYRTTKRPTIQQSSKGSIASSSIIIDKPEASAWIYSDVGAFMQVTGAPADAKVRITTQVKYTMSASGGDDYNNAWVVVNGGQPTYDVFRIESPNTQSATIPYVWDTTVGAFFWSDGTASIDAEAGCQVVSEFNAGQASATVEFSSIVVEFLA